MKKTLLVSAFLCLFISGCLSFGKDEETTTPNSTQIARCRKEMYLNPSVKITPLGYRIDGSGIDDFIWFKFKTNVENISDIFDKTVVDTSTFKTDHTFHRNMNDLKWWDANDKKMIGESISLPNARYMDVGIEKQDDGYLVYIMWNET
jgi:hypothetical protein